VPQTRRCWRSRKAAREARLNLGAIEKHGVDRPIAVNPFNGELVPIWVAIIFSADYGTGAIMSVPAHDERDFEFAAQIWTCRAPRNWCQEAATNDLPDLPYTAEDDAVLVDSGAWTSKSCEQAQREMAAFAQANGFGSATVTYRLKGLGRQPPALTGARRFQWCIARKATPALTWRLSFRYGGRTASSAPAQVEITQQEARRWAGRGFRPHDLPVCGGPAQR